MEFPIDSMDDILECEYQKFVELDYSFNESSDYAQEVEVEPEVNELVYDNETENLRFPDIPDCNILERSKNEEDSLTVNSSSLEKSTLHRKDNTTIDNFFDETRQPCCTLKCNRKIPKNLALQHRQVFMEIEKREQDLIILGNLQSHRQTSCLNEFYGKSTNRRQSHCEGDDADLQRNRITYYFHHLPICRQMYLFLYGLGVTRFGNLVKHFDARGIALRCHKNRGKKPNRTNVLSVTDIETVVQFIKNFAEKVAIPLPGQMANHKNCRVVKLPPCESKVSVYKRYIEACKDQSFKTIGLHSFTIIWNKHLPFVTTNRSQTENLEYAQEVEMETEVNELLYDYETENLQFPDISDGNVLERSPNEDPLTTNGYFLEESSTKQNDHMIIDDFFDETCESCCTQKCNRKIPKNLAIQHRQVFIEMEKNEQDLIILSHLQAHRQVSCLAQYYGVLTNRGDSPTKEDEAGLPRHRQSVTYFFLNLPICRQMYFFLHNLGVTRFENLVKQFDAQGIALRRPGSKGITQDETDELSVTDIEAVVKFIKNYAEKVAIPLPGQTANPKNYTVVKLPRREPKVSVYNRYIEACQDQSFKTMDIRSFRNIWDKYLPFITTKRTKSVNLNYAQEVEMETEVNEVLYDNEIENVQIPDDNIVERSQNEEAPLTANSSFLEESSIDRKDDTMIDDFFDETRDPCCTLMCNRNIPKNLAVEHRRVFMEKEKSEQDLIILAHLQAHRSISCLTEFCAISTNGGQSLRKEDDADLQGHLQSITYYFYNLPICRQMYLFLYGLDVTRFKNLVKHFDAQGISYGRGNTEITPNRTNILSVTNTEAVVQFIKNFAEKLAIPLQGRMADHKNYRVVKLPSCESKFSVYKRYIDACKDLPIGTMDFRSFDIIWNKHLPFVTTRRLEFDLCEFCQTNINLIQHSANLSESKKLKMCQDELQHLKKVKIERDYYNMWRSQAKSTGTIKIDRFDREITFSVLSFDFAEDIHYPSSPQQMRSAYFKTMNKCSVFGVHDERSHVQTNYLIDEADSVGKRANTVISLLDFHLNQIDSQLIILFADTCVEQNKNDVMIQYLYWRVLMKKNLRIELNFIPIGHTKFSPDRNFGIFKAKFATTIVDCLSDAMDCVLASSPNGFNQVVSTVVPNTRERVVQWSFWDKYLAELFKKFPGIAHYNHFIFEGNNGIVTKLYVDSESTLIHPPTATLKTVRASVIEEIVPEELTPERQWYLYEQIRSLCSDPTKADLVAPKPLVPNPKDLKKIEKHNAKVDALRPSVPGSCSTKKSKRSNVKLNAPGSSVQIPRKRYTKKAERLNVIFDVDGTIFTPALLTKKHEKARKSNSLVSKKKKT